MREEKRKSKKQRNCSRGVTIRVKVGNEEER